MVLIKNFVSTRKDARLGDRVECKIHGVKVGNKWVIKQNGIERRI